MKTFEADGKINFIDKNNVFVGFDYGQSCCEHFGYFLTISMPQHDQVEGDTDLNLDTEGYVFDKDFYEDYSGSKVPKYGPYNNMVTFRLTHETKPELFLSLFNHHNGYYSHGFTMTTGGENLRSGNL